MINNYDSVVARPYSATPHSQKQESTSYTPTKRTWLSLLTVLITLFCFSFVQGQIGVTVTGSTNTTPALSASYSTLAAALTDLNAVTAMSGPVVLTLDSGTSETAPVKGYVLGSATLNQVLSATNTITINKSGAGAVTINAGIGTSNGPSVTPDGMFYLNGADYVTIDGITFTDGNSTNATVAMEFGLAMFKRTAGDGCNNNTVQNCIFNMQRINNTSGSAPMVDGAVGILVINSTAAAAVTALTPTNGGTLATNGTNSNNKFYTNTINGGNYGIALSGFAATTGVGPTPTATTFLGDLGNDVGGSTSGTGNTILNFGGGAATSPAAGIRANNQWSVNVSNNIVNNNNGSGANHATTLRGIFLQAGTSANVTCTYNTVTIKGGGTTSSLTAIDNAIGGTALSNIVNINNNTVQNCTYATATSGSFTCISNSASASTVNINNNTIQNNSVVGAATSSVFTGIVNSGSTGTTLNIGNNVISGITLSSTGICPFISVGSPGGTANVTNNTIQTITNAGVSGTMRGIIAATPVGLYTCSGNTIENLSYSTATSTGSIDGIYNLSAATLQNWNNNIIRNFSTPTTGTLQGIRNNTTTGTFQCKNNQIYNFFTTAGGAGGFSANGILWSNSNVEISGNVIYSLNSTGSTGGSAGTINGISSGGSATIYNNKIYDLSSTSTGPLVAGITISGGTTNNIYNNLIGDLRANAANAATGTPDMVKGINITSTSTSSNQNVYNNTIYLNASSSGANFGTSGIFHTSSGTSTTSALDLQNNIIINTSTAAGTGKTVAFRRSGGGFDNFRSTSNNNLFFAGVPSASNLIMSDNNLQNYQTISDYKNASGLSPRETNSFTESSITPATYFESTTGSNANYLQPKAGLVSQIEGGGNTIAMTSPDYNGVTRPGGTGTSFDLGAWEFEGISPAPVLTTLVATPALTAQCTKADRAIAIDVTTSSGTISSVVLNYSHNGVAQTPVTMTNTSGNTYTGTMIAPTTGNATVTWSIAATNSIGLTTVYNGTSYADEPTTGITATATASVNPVCAGSPTSLNMIINSGSINITEGFEGATFPPTGWTILNAGSGNNWITSTTPKSGAKAMQYSYNGSNAANTWMFTPAQQLLAGQTYTISFWYNTGGFAEKLKVTAGTTATTASQTNVIWSNTSLTNTTYAQATATFIAPTSGTYYFAFNCFSAANQYNLYVDDISITGGLNIGTPSYSWSDGTSVVGTTNPLVVNPTATTTYTGTATVNGCPITATTTVTANPLPTAPTVTSSTQCGTQIPTASVADTNSFTTPTFKWYDAATAGTVVQSSTSTTFTTAISATTTFYVAVVHPTTGCESPRTAVTVSVSTPDAITATSTATSICIGQSITLTAANSATTPAQTYAYSWLSAANSGVATAQSGASITATPTAAGTYTYTVSAVDGSCQTTNTVTVTVNPLPVITTATANPTVACAGSTINLAATINEVSSGSATIGVGATTSSTYSNPFYSLWSNNHTQHLITAAELSAMGLSSGNITSVGLNVTSAGSLPMINFSVKIGTTSSTSMTAFVSNSAFQTVFTSASLMPTTGVNTLTFSTPFNWDGTSNLVLEFCHGNSASSSTMNRTVQADNTSYVSTVKSHISSATAASTTCGDTSTNLLSYSVRPVFIFGGQVVANTTSNYDWSWSDGSATVLSTASGTATLPAGATTTYTVTATNRTTLCSASQNVTVSTAVSALALTGVTPATSNICVGSSVTLIAAPTGGCIPYTYSWSDGTSEVGTSASLTVSPTSTKTYTVTVVDNTGTATVNASSTITVNNPQPASVVNQTICAASSAFTLSAVASVTSNLLNWYAASTGGSVLASGATFTTPAISSTTTYYVEENEIGTQYNSAKTAPTNAGSDYWTNYGIVFNASKKVKLNEVTVYATSTSTSNITIKLLDNTGVQVPGTSDVIVNPADGTGTTATIVPLNYIIPAGNGYRLVVSSGMTSSNKMVQETTGIVYPYTNNSISVIAGSTGTTNSTTGYYWFYDLKVSDVCTGIRVPVTATLNAPPVVTLGSASATICSGQSTAAVALTSDPLSFTGYTWSPAAGVSGSTTGWTFNPTSTTTYTLNATDGTCSNTTTFTVNVNPSPSAMTITPATPAVCVDAIQALTVSGGTISNVSILNETFNGTPTGWTAENNSSGGTPANAAWQIYISDINASSNDNSNFIGSNSDEQGSGGTTDTSITSPVFNLSNFSSASLNFYHHFNSYSSADSAKVQVSTNGSTWVDVTTYTTDQGALTGFALSTINLNAYVGNSSVQVRFKYNASWGLYWLIDNVSVTGTQTTTVTWSPITNLYSDAAATVPYVLNANASTVYVKSATAATTTYTVTSTAAGTACTNTASVNVVVNPLPTVITVNQTICAPSTVNLQNAAVTLGSDAGLTYTYWTNAAATTALTSPNAVATSGTYYIKGTNANGCSVVTPVTVTVNPLPVLTITNPATVCSPNTVDITAAAVTAGSEPGTLSYWSDSTATTALTTASAVTTSGTYYIKVVNANGCEKIMPVTVTINVTSAPTGAATQTFCGSANITQLIAVGSGIKWYDAATGGNLLPNITAIGLTNGTTYYASQTVNGCESTDRFAVTVVVNTIPTAPNASAQSFCNSATVADLLPSGSSYNWYSAATGGSALASSDVLSSNTYYVSQTLNGCESARTAVTVTINTTAAPTAADQSFCNSALVANLTATGTNLSWYLASTGGSALSPSTSLTSTTYYVSQTLNGCESSRTAVLVTVNTTSAPTASAQTFCTSATVADLTASGSNLSWYSNSTGGTALTSGTTLSTGIYYVSQNVDGCESPRTAVNVTISTPSTPTGNAVQTIYGGVASDATIEDINVNGSNIVWYPTPGDAAAGTNAIPAGTQLVDGAVYYAVSVVGTCRSAALAVTVTVVLDNASFDIKSLKYYPNPVVDRFTVSYTKSITAIQVYDINGRLVKNLQTNGNEVNVDMSDVAASVYIVKVFADDTMGEFKVVKTE